MIVLSTGITQKLDFFCKHHLGSVYNVGAVFFKTLALESVINSYFSKFVG